ncbi:hypothetical protein CEUSTIGMA_g8024.t1 [Chlamydomonas eustigma]|uniref:Uncharacterized protein n=1 Tax=Chlamydomonas eustigma TaxID=1157962 RepID=A0A250XBW7_9CHLO|nr:hypothetical protein CEUSTIGMA_g8024.t1 [Chlamydomonas eustigma]|eukprot:GAX80587.1 hypothetical protein CEUSTIGMA_g8024.t1 [Chlamydomonas eustigma]
MDNNTEPFEDGQHFAFDTSKEKSSSSRRHSLAALKDIVTGKKDWWEKKASKTGAVGKGSKVASMVMPNLAHNKGGLLFSLQTNDQNNGTSQQDSDPRPRTPVSMSLPQLQTLTLDPPQISPQNTDRSPGSRALGRILSKLTGRSPKSANTSPSGLCGSASRAQQLPMSDVDVFGSPTPSIEDSVGRADDTEHSKFDQSSSVQGTSEEVLTFSPIEKKLNQKSDESTLLPLNTITSLQLQRAFAEKFPATEEASFHDAEDCFEVHLPANDAREPGIETSARSITDSESVASFKTQPPLVQDLQLLNPSCWEKIEGEPDEQKRENRPGFAEVEVDDKQQHELMDAGDLNTTSYHKGSACDEEQDDQDESMDAGDATLQICEALVQLASSAPPVSQCPLIVLEMPPQDPASPHPLNSTCCQEEETLHAASEVDEIIHSTSHMEVTLLANSHVVETLYAASDVEETLHAASHVEETFYAASHVEETFYAASHVEETFYAASHVEETLHAASPMLMSPMMLDNDCPPTAILMPCDDTPDQADTQVIDMRSQPRTNVADMSPVRQIDSSFSATAIELQYSACYGHMTEGHSEVDHLCPQGSDYNAVSDLINESVVPVTPLRTPSEPVEVQGSQPHLSADLERISELSRPEEPVMEQFPRVEESGHHHPIPPGEEESFAMDIDDLEVSGIVPLPNEPAILLPLVEGYVPASETVVAESVCALELSLVPDHVMENDLHASVQSDVAGAVAAAIALPQVEQMPVPEIEPQHELPPALKDLSFTSSDQSQKQQPFVDRNAMAAAAEEQQPFVDRNTMAAAAEEQQPFVDRNAKAAAAAEEQQQQLQQSHHLGPLLEQAQEIMHAEDEGMEVDPVEFSDSAFSGGVQEALDAGVEAWPYAPMQCKDPEVEESEEVHALAEEEGAPTMEALEAWLKGGSVMPTAAAAAAGSPASSHHAAAAVSLKSVLLPASPIPFTNLHLAPASPSPSLMLSMQQEEEGSPLFQPMDMSEEGGMSTTTEVHGFTFSNCLLEHEFPPLETTPSPVASQTNSPRVTIQVCPHFNACIRQSFIGQDSLSLDRLSLDDIAPFSRKKQQQQPVLSTLLEDPDSAILVSGAASPEEAAGNQAPQQQQQPYAFSPLPGPFAPPAARAPAASVTPGGAINGRAIAAKAAAASALKSASSSHTPATGAGAARGRFGGPSPVPTSMGSKLSSALHRDPAGTPLSQQVTKKVVGGAIKRTTPLAATPKAPAAVPANHSSQGTTPSPPLSGRTYGLNPWKPVLPSSRIATKLATPAAADNAVIPQEHPSPHHVGNLALGLSPVASARASPLSSAEKAALAAQNQSTSHVAAAVATTPTPPAATAASMAARLAALMPSSWATPLAQMAALPVEAALRIPLGDASPFGLEDWSNENSNIAEEARKLFSTLAVGEGGQKGKGLRTPVNVMASHLGNLMGSHVGIVPLPSPNSVQVLEMQVQMMLQKLADAEGQQAALEKENEGLRDQLRTMEFQSVMPSEGVDDMERQARQCAEEQLALMAQQLQAAEEVVGRLKKEASESNQQSAAMQWKLEEERVAYSVEVETLKFKLNEVTQERDASFAEAQSLAAQLSSKAKECDTFQSTLLSEQRRLEELQQVARAKDAECSLLQRMNADTSAKLQKALENLTTVQVSQRRQAAESESKTAALGSALSRIQHDRDNVSQELSAATLRLKEAESQMLKMREQLAASGKENKELLGICNELLSQVEKGTKDASK